MKKYATVKEFTEDFPEIKDKLQKVIDAIKKAAPDAEETFSYGIPTYKLNGKTVIHFSAYKSHIGLYPGAEAIEVFKDKLKNYKTSKGTVQFQFDKPIPYDLIEEITNYRVRKL